MKTVSTTIYVCYYEYDEEEWDNCSHPVTFFHSKLMADEWKDRNGDTARVQEMEYGRVYATR